LLDHPHICVLHDIGSQDGSGYMVMEYMEGETLAIGWVVTGNWRIRPSSREMAWQRT